MFKNLKINLSCLLLAGVIIINPINIEAANATNNLSCSKNIISYESKKNSSTTTDPVKVKSNSSKKNYKTEDGLLYSKISYSIPVLEGKQKGIQIINEYYDAKYKKWLKELKSKLPSEEQFLTENRDSAFYMNSYFEHEYKYTVKYNKNGYISITEYVFDYDLGAHGLGFQSSHTFDVNTGKELKLTDVIKGTDKQIKKTIANAFHTKINKNEEAYYPNAMDMVNSMVNSKFENWYLNNKGIVFYFNAYEIASYANGIQTASVAYNKNTFKIKIK